LQVQEIVYYGNESQVGEATQEPLKAAMINDWVYREGQQITDFSSGQKVTFEVLRILPDQVVLRRGQQDFVLPARSRS
jgi:hypothetical protein